VKKNIFRGGATLFGSIYIPGWVSFSSKEGTAVVVLLVVAVVTEDVAAVVFATDVDEVFGTVVVAEVVVAPAVQPESNIIIKPETRIKPGSILFVFTGPPFPVDASEKEDKSILAILGSNISFVNTHHY
jgi:hypothetical protein